DFHVTGVQTCALPIYPFGYALRRSSFALMSRNKFGINGRSKKSSLNKNLLNFPCSALGEKNSPSNFIFCIKFFMAQTVFLRLRRSEERRVGKERSVGW